MQSKAPDVVERGRLASSVGSDRLVGDNHTKRDGSEGGLPGRWRACPLPSFITRSAALDTPVTPASSGIMAPSSNIIGKSRHCSMSSSVAPITAFLPSIALSMGPTTDAASRQRVVLPVPLGPASSNPKLVG